MTTIVASLEGMAADTRVTWTDRDNDRVNSAYGSKIERVGDEIIGTAGDYAAGVRFMEWVRAGRPKKRPRLIKDFRALVLSSQGIFFVDGTDPTPMPVGPTFYAIGSGAPYALGALEMGASLERAVDIAKMYDVYSGGKVTSLSLKL